MTKFPILVKTSQKVKNPVVPPIRPLRPYAAFDCKAYERLYAFMTHDKKNTAGSINFTLLGDIGDRKSVV